MYLTLVPSARMVRQELPMSCGAACARQLLLDAGLVFSEADIRERAGFDPQIGGITSDFLAMALEQLHTDARYKGGAIWPEDLEALAARGPFIALLRTPTRHFVIVDGVGQATVSVRDPAGTQAGPTVGADGIMDRIEFVERWTQACNGIVYRYA